MNVEKITFVNVDGIALLARGIPWATEGVDIVHTYPPCQNWHTSAVDRLNAHGYSVARNLRHRIRNNPAGANLGLLRSVMSKIHRTP